MPKKVFERVSTFRNPHSGFDLSFEKKLSFDMGQLIPIMLQEVIPGDRFRVNSEVMVRFAPLLAPIMHRVNVYTHYFFVPNRIVWDSWEDFITGGSEATGIASPTFPVFTLSTTEEDDLAKGTLADYLGIPIQTGGAGWGMETVDINALPFRGYHMIWNEYYRDQHQQDTENIGSLTWNNAKNLKTRAWEKDYFTSCQPTAQRGAELSVPLEIDYLSQTQIYEDDGTDPTTIQQLRTANTSPVVAETGVDGPVRFENLDPASTGTKIRELRQALKLQEYAELAMRAGTRYIEWLKAMFGVRSSDARLQRPEYLGGGMQRVQISEVLNTAGDPASGNTAVGDMAGHGIAVGNRNGFTKRFEEFGYVFGIMSILPRTAYQQGLERHWTKFDRFDYFTPQLAHIGEQAVLNKEVYFNMSDPAARPDHDATFGYQQQYAEYKQNFDNVHGDFKDNLDFWHMGRKFAFSSPPSLNEDFIKSDPTKRIFAVDDGTHSIWAQVYHDIKASRPIPFFTDPKLL